MKYKVKNNTAKKKLNWRSYFEVYPYKASIFLVIKIECSIQRDKCP